MSCFLACFGFSGRRKHPTSAHKSDHISHGCYKPLDHHSNKDIHNPSNPTIPHSNFSDEGVNRCGVAVKKKVTFAGSIVRTYEPIEDDDCTSQVLEDGKEEIDKVEEKGPSGKDSFTSQMINTYPSSYRYQNLSENWYEEEEEEDIIYEESDELLDDDDDIQESNEDDSDVEFYLSQVETEDDKIFETKRSRKYISPVLLPVENITQWRTLKAKHKRSAKSKENIESEIIDPEPELNPIAQMPINGS